MKKENTITIKKCQGCGATLQNIDNSKAGYVPYHNINEASYCQRCFKLKNYNEKVMNEVIVNEDEIINEINKSKSYAFFLIDFLNISKFTIDSFKKININKTLVISKSDLIFKDINLDKIKNKIKSIYNINDNIIFLSSKKNYNTNLIFSVLNKNNIKKGYILGFTNAGKSTLINSLKEDDKILESSMPNTTLDFIKLKIKDYEIIDTPGFNYKNTFYKEKEFNLIKRLNPVYFVSPINYQVKDNQIFLIEDRLFLKNFGVNNITFYISNLIKIKKIYKDDDIEYKEIMINDNSDIVVSSLGFINVKKSCKLFVNKDMVDIIEIRDSII